MATLKNLENLIISGKLGDVVLVNRKGKLHFRSRPKKREKPLSPAQLKQVSVIKAVSPFIAKVKPVVKMGFAGKSDNDKDSALSFLMKNAVDKSGPVAVLDYTRVLVTRGDLMAPAGGQADYDPTDGLTIQWNDNSGTGSARASDRGLIAAYCPEVHEAICVTENGPQRDKKYISVPVSGLYAGRTLHVYLSFISASGRDISKSVYLGEVEVS